MTVVATLKDGRVIAKALLPQGYRSDAGDIALLATVTDLKTVEYVLQYNFDVSGAVNVDPRNAKIDGNVVGVTVYVGGETSVSGEVIVVGF